MPIATDPIGAIRKELIGAARRRAAVRRRRRRRLVALATGASMLIVVGGVGAVADLGTGVPAIDHVLGVERNDPAPLGGTSDSFSGPPGTDIRPAPGSTSERVRIPVAARGEGAVGLAYTSVRGEVCFVEGVMGAEGFGESGGSVRGCWPTDLLARRVARETAIVTGSEFGAATVLNGFAAADVERLRVRGPSGPLEVELTGVWTPNAYRAEPLRVFVAVDRSGADTDGRRREGFADAMDLRSYELEAELEGGQTARVGP